MDGERAVAGQEEAPLEAEQVDLAIGRDPSLRPHKHGGVEDAVGRRFGQAADSEAVTVAAERNEFLGCRAAGDRLGKPLDLGGVDELVARGEELRQHPEVG